MYDSHKKPAAMSGRSFVSLAGAILMIVLLSGGLAIFGLFYSAEKQTADQDRLDAMFHLAYGASRAWRPASNANRKQAGCSDRYNCNSRPSGCRTTTVR